MSLNTSYMKYLFSLLLMVLAGSTYAQPEGLAAYFTFENNDALDVSGNGNNGTIVGNPTFDCGLRGEAMWLNTTTSDDHVLWLGILNNLFNRRDFSISFYIKPTNQSNPKVILSKREPGDCGQLGSFVIRYLPSQNSVSVELSEDPTKNGNVQGELSPNQCWQHIVYVRSGNESMLYINGALADRKNAGSRVDVDNNGILVLGRLFDNGGCSVIDNVYTGLIDELRFYDRAIKPHDVEFLYESPDQISVSDTTIFLGQSVTLRLQPTCSNQFLWSPDATLDDKFSPTPLATPIETTTYAVNMQDNICIAFDTVRVIVIDPALLDCQQIFLPKAFTPNGDNLNDRYGISNPNAEQNLVSFEIFDRWGSRVFFTDDPFVTWDGSFKGEPINPGVLLYRVKYICDGDTKVDVGSISILR